MFKISSLSWRQLGPLYIVSWALSGRGPRPHYSLSPSPLVLLGGPPAPAQTFVFHANISTYICVLLSYKRTSKIGSSTHPHHWCYWEDHQRPLKHSPIFPRVFSNVCKSYKNPVKRTCKIGSTTHPHHWCYWEDQRLCFTDVHVFFKGISYKISSNIRQYFHVSSQMYANPMANIWSSLILKCEIMKISGTGYSNPWPGFHDSAIFCVCCKIWHTEPWVLLVKYSWSSLPQGIPSPGPPFLLWPYISPAGIYWRCGQAGDLSSSISIFFFFHSELYKFLIFLKIQFVCHNLQCKLATTIN